MEAVQDHSFRCEPWVYELRAQFPAAQRVAFFDIAYENCGALFTRRAMERFFDDKAHVYPGMVKAGGKGKGDMIPRIARARALTAQLLNAPGERSIAFTKNTNDGINILLHGFPFQPGDNIVAGDLEHVSVLGPCLNMKSFGVGCRLARSRDGVTLSAEELLAAADAHTRMIVVSYVQSRSGYRIDLGALVRACHKRNIFVVTDAIQALGFVDVDFQALGVDALVSSCYKGLLSIEGIGILCCGDALLRLVRPAFLADNAATALDREKGMVTITDPLCAQKYENGTISFLGVYALESGIEQLLSIGTGRIAAHVSACFETLYRRLAALGYRILTPFEPAQRCNSILFETGRAEEAAAFFMKHGVYLSRGCCDCVRASISAFTAPEDLDALCAAAAAWKAQQE